MGKGWEKGKGYSGKSRKVQGKKGKSKKEGKQIESIEEKMREREGKNIEGNLNGSERKMDQYNPMKYFDK